MPCCPFIGINNHNQSLQFGCGFVRDEKLESYKWLFTTFLECMDGLAPMNIIMDQDFAMRGAIESVFPLAIHRHCRWHIFSKAEETLGTVFAANPELHQAFEVCVDHSLTPKEFDSSWMQMIEKYNMQENETLANLWEIRTF